MSTIVNIKKNDKNAIIPTRGSIEAAGYDLYAFVCDGDEKGTAVLAPGETMMIDTGISIEIPTGYAGFVYARSGLATKSGLAPANKVGVIDSDYRGRIFVALHNHSNEYRYVNHGDRIAQIVIAPVLNVEFNEVDELSDTDRGEGGFGSTGTN